MVQTSTTELHGLLRLLPQLGIARVQDAGLMGKFDPELASEKLMPGVFEVDQESPIREAIDEATRLIGMGSSSNGNITALTGKGLRQFSDPSCRFSDHSKGRTLLPIDLVGACLGVRLAATV